MDVAPLAGFAFVASITPGPNNVMLWASGLNFGLRRTVPHLAGVSLGFASVLTAVGFGLGTLVLNAPFVGVLLRVVGGGYLLYLAYRVATAGATAERAAGDGSRPMRFVEAAAFQYLNPKAWVIAVSGAGLAIPEGEPLRTTVPLFVVTFAAVNLPCITTWAGAGNLVGRLLDDPRWRRRINVSLGVLLACSVVLIVV